MIFLPYLLESYLCSADYNGLVSVMGLPSFEKISKCCSLTFWNARQLSECYFFPDIQRELRVGR